MPLQQVGPSDIASLSFFANDVYHRGYGPGARLNEDLGTAFNGATIVSNLSSTNLAVAAESVGFHALAYQDTSGKIVISFRGTDNGLIDVLNGWTGGAGFWSSAQSQIAVEFYKTVRDQFPDHEESDFTLTGHSLGGGLAGFVSSLTGVQAVVFDNMTYELSAKVLYLTALVARAHESLSGISAASLNSEFSAQLEQLGFEINYDSEMFWIDLGLPGFFAVQLTDDFLELARTYYSAGEYPASIPLNNPLTFDAVLKIATDGEVLSYVRSSSGSDSETINYDAFFGGSARTDFSQIADYINAGVGGFASGFFLALPGGPVAILLAATGGALIAIGAQDAYELTQDAVAKHSMSLLSARLYMEATFSEAEKADIAYMGGALTSFLYDDAVANAVGITGSEPGEAATALLLRLAYSGVSGAGTPHGTTALHAMFDDARDVGKILEGVDLPFNLGFTTDSFAVRGAFGQSIVQFAGDLARSENSDAAFRDGFIRTQGNNLISIDYSAAYWTAAAGGKAYTPEQMLGRDVVIDRFDYDDYFQAGSLFGSAASQAIWYYLGTTDSVIDRIHFVAPSTGVTVDLQAIEHAITVNSATVASSNRHADFLIVTDFDDYVTGSNRNEFIDAKDGLDTIHGGGGNDIIVGGDDSDLIFGGDGVDVAVYRGNRDDYIILNNADGSYSIYTSSLINSLFESGSDTLRGVEQIFFGDGEVLNLGGYVPADPEHMFGIHNPGTENDDILLGTQGDDFLGGEIAYSPFTPSPGNDRMYGGDGNDVLMIGQAGDRAYGGNGFDTLRFLIEAPGSGAVVEFSSASLTLGNTTIARGIEYFLGTFAPGPDSSTRVEISLEEFDYDFSLSGRGGGGGTRLSSSVEFLAIVIERSIAFFSLRSGRGDDTLFFQSASNEFLELYGGGGNDAIGAFFDGSPAIGIFDGGDGVDRLYLDANGLTGDNFIDFTSNAPQRLSNGAIISDFEILEQINLGSGNDTIHMNLLQDESQFIDGRGGYDRARVYADQFSDDLIVSTDGYPGFYIGFFENAQFIWYLDEWSLSETITQLSDFEEIEFFSGSGNDYLYGAGGNDAFYGGDGDDFLNGKIGADTLVGGLGDDTYVTDGGDSISEAVNAGTDQVNSSVSYTLGANLENLVLAGTAAINGTGNSLNNLISGNTASNVLIGGNGADRLFGGMGDDFMGGGSDNDSLFGGEGNDTIYTGSGDDFVGGGAGDDLVYGSTGRTTIYAGLGNDTVQGGSGSDTIYGSAGRNQLFGNNGNDLIFTGLDGDFIGGGAGNDTVRGGDGADTIYAGLGDDFIGGGAGNDQIFGSVGSNVIYAGLGNDTVQGGSGSDTIFGSAGRNQLFGNDGNDLIYTSAGGDFAAGGAGNDSIFGSDGADTIYAGLGDDSIGGGAGNDAIFAGAGANRIYGGVGDDTITAGVGRDVMTGGPGADVFVFASAAAIGIGAARDVITDFTPGVDDIDLRALGTTFNGTAGVLGGGTASFYYFAAGGLLIGDQNGDGAADWVLELTGAPGVTAGDFIL